MRTKVLFVLLPYYIEHGGRTRKCPTVPYGILSIAKYISDCAEVRIFDCNVHDDHIAALIRELEYFSPSVVGLNMMYDSCFLSLESVATAIKDHNDSITLLLGGAATPYVYNEVISRVPLLDAICYRDGEIPMRDYLTTFKFNKSWITKAGDVPEVSMLDRLDEVIDVDFSLVNVADYQTDLIAENFSPFVNIKTDIQLYTMGSRGCCFSCIFCHHSGNPVKRIRRASVGSIMSHIEKLIDQYGMTVLSLYDEQLLVNKKWAKELFRGLQKYNLTIKIPGGITPIFVDEEMVDLMWQAGVDAVGIALESASEKILKLMKKPVNLDQVRMIMKYFRKYNFFIRAFLVLGIPGETDDDRKESLEFVREIKPDVISPNIASPILGSTLRKQCIEMGYIKTTELGLYNRMEPMISTEEYSSEHIKEQMDRINWQINFIENYRMKIGDYHTASLYLKYVCNKYPHEAFAWYFLNECNDKLGLPRNLDGLRKCLADNPHWVNRFREFNVPLEGQVNG